ncbi:hypothetical protein HG536_0A07030 [Torulaspora globosa]|uniref:Transcription initiation factor IIA large subunit n=1 Tax=Torulaspora globosa TaxID=48254 RepID=A0A7G3ZBK2_9SACH|nr:uncharacterized protein HG536_0A07030 [Torulaspora globosa]QLL30888.1 hypothetical protein HG536_0A07030 [Torulaspora globosa]
MSNSEASRVYETIVESVVNEVREDFENAGIDEQTLQDLKRVWQLKLSETQVANFSWDPQENATQQSVDAIVNGNGLANDDGTGKNFAVPSEYSLNNESQGLVLPGFATDDSNKIDTASTETQNGKGLEDKLGTNGSGDASDSGNVDDSLKRESEPKIQNSREIELTLSYPDSQAADLLKQEAKKAKRSALLDTDEVGSELDDSDDDYLISEGEDDGPDENLMLCLYDKVTRTKARWKCSLKDGVATINRKDYTFQKSQVEAEWV